MPARKANPLLDNERLADETFEAYPIDVDEGTVSRAANTLQFAEAVNASPSGAAEPPALLEIAGFIKRGGPLTKKYQPFSRRSANYE